MSIKRAFLPTKTSKKRSLLLISLLLILYIIENSQVTKLVSSYGFIYIPSIIANQRNLGEETMMKIIQYLG